MYGFHWFGANGDNPVRLLNRNHDNAAVIDVDILLTNPYDKRTDKPIFDNLCRVVNPSSSFGGNSLFLNFWNPDSFIGCCSRCSGASSPVLLPLLAIESEDIDSLFSFEMESLGGIAVAPSCTRLRGRQRCRVVVFNWIIIDSLGTMP